MRPAPPPTVFSVFPSAVSCSSVESPVAGNDNNSEPVIRTLVKQSPTAEIMIMVFCVSLFTLSITLSYLLSDKLNSLVR